MWSDAVNRSPSSWSYPFSLEFTTSSTFIRAGYAPVANRRACILLLQTAEIDRRLRSIRLCSPSDLASVARRWQQVPRSSTMISQTGLVRLRKGGLVSLAKRGINAVLDVPHQLCGMFLSIFHEQSAFVSTDVVRGPEKWSTAGDNITKPNNRSHRAWAVPITNRGLVQITRASRNHVPQSSHQANAKERPSA